MELPKTSQTFYCSISLMYALKICSLTSKPRLITQLVTQNHDAQVRFKWNRNDLAVWDNRSTWHCATYDYDAARAGDRVCSLGEAPYFDPNSKSRREALL